MPISLVLAYDHPLILNGLTNLILLENDMHVLASCTNGFDALKAVRSHQPDVGGYGYLHAQDERAGSLQNNS